MSDLPPQYGMDRQFGIYMGGMGGVRPTLPIDPTALEAAAKAVLSAEAYGYVAGGAGTEATMRANRAAFDRWQIVPRMLRNVAQRDLHVALFGANLSVPLLLAPIGVQSIVHPEAEVAVARAAASLNVPFVLSTASSKSLEEVAAAAGAAPHWYQLYWGRNPDVTVSMLARAEAAGYTALVVTLDTALLSWRARDLQNAYLPFLLGQGLANYLSDPAFRAALPEPPEANPTEAIRYFISIFSNPTLTWEDLRFLRAHTRLPIILKGILHEDDARTALDYGMDGLIVSNHGGRQVDGAVGALEALPRVVTAVQGAIPVLFDSGIRGGSDILKALALGARAVLLGRPYIWGLALGGEAGVREVLLNTLADFDLTLALSGHATAAAVTATALRRAE
ncbi:MAG: alpha-hydroxy-acid oxidizing protein [Ktedonobacterales bacterium]|nr:alpha-hydroxy-acid oxidizing protein [Ktedonobacterales bacterium]